MTALHWLVLSSLLLLPLSPCPSNAAERLGVMGEMELKRIEDTGVKYKVRHRTIICLSRTNRSIMHTMSSKGTLLSPERWNSRVWCGVYSELQRWRESIL